MSDLIEQCTRGDKGAWDAFVDQYGALIYAAVVRAIGRGGHVSNERIEDITQDVFVRLVDRDYRLLRTYDPSRAALTTWLTIVARSTAIDAVRRKGLPTVPLDDQAEPASTAHASDPPNEASTPTSMVPAGLLSPRQKLVLQMLFDREMEVADVAELLGIDPQTVRTTKHKAIEKLRSHFANTEPL